MKVFSTTGSGKPRFHKDGYTDRLGKFDYAGLNVDSLGAPIARLAILAISEELGAAIEEARPPPGM